MAYLMPGSWLVLLVLLAALKLRGHTPMVLQESNSIYVSSHVVLQEAIGGSGTHVRRHATQVEWIILLTQSFTAGWPIHSCNRGEVHEGEELIWQN